MLYVSVKWVNSVSIVTRLCSGWLGFNSQTGQGFFYYCS